VCGCSVLDSAQEESVLCRFDFYRGFSGQHVSMYINDNQIMEDEELVSVGDIDLAFRMDKVAVEPQFTIKLVVDEKVHFFSIDTNEGAFIRIYLIESAVGIEQSHNPFPYL
jgi:hypothetical protein